MPVWHERTKLAVENGSLALLGVIQEQHAERCQLFAQWKGFEWPILHDAINVIGPRAVPIVVAIDEGGIVRAVNPKPDAFATFMASNDVVDDSPSATRTASRQHLYEQAIKLANSDPKETKANREFGDGLILWGSDDDLDAAVNAYQRAAKQTPDDGASHFRLGVALRRRYESSLRKPDDFPQAVAHWNRALEIDPNHYIWRRRIQQYGPRMTKPYAFYDWVNQAQSEIRARGDEPVPMRVELTRAELAFPAKRTDFLPDSAKEPDPEDKISRDTKGLVRMVATVVPPSAKPNSTVRVFLEMEPDASRDVHWTNDAGPMVIWVDSDTSQAGSMRVEKSTWEVTNTESATSHETRTVEFEAQLPDDLGDSAELSGYVLYYVCVGESGTCVYLRKDISVSIKNSSRR